MAEESGSQEVLKEPEGDFTSQPLTASPQEPQNSYPPLPLADSSVPQEGSNPYPVQSNSVAPAAYGKLCYKKKSLLINHVHSVPGIVIISKSCRGYIG